VGLELLEETRAAQLVQTGEVIAYPTEAVYGLGCDPMSETAVTALLKLKKRNMEQGLIVIGSSLDQFKDLVQTLTSEQLQPALAGWPGPFTWLLPAAVNCPVWIRGQHTTIAVRISTHPVCRRLCELLHGPLVSTSANPVDGPPARTLVQLEEYFHDGLAGVVQGELGGLEQATPIRDLISGKLIRGN